MKVSIEMPSTMSGKSFKGPRLEPIIKELHKRKMLSECYGFKSNTDKTSFESEIRSKLKYTVLTRIILKAYSFLPKGLKRTNHYLLMERLFYQFSKFHRCTGEVVVLKPRPYELVKRLREQGKIIIVEASENHTKYTYEQVMKEYMEHDILVKKNKDNYINIEAVEKFSIGIKNADYLICLSEFSKSTYIKYGIDPNRIYVVQPYGVFERIYNKIDLDEEVTFICTANHSVLKGTQRLINIWVENNIQNDLLLIGGFYAGLNNYMEKARKNPHIKIIGQKSAEELIDLYSSRKCVGVLLSVSEAFGRCVYEYLCCSLPVIVTETCTCDLVKNGENGFIVKHDNNEIYEAVKRYAEMDNQSFEQMRQLAYECSNVENKSFSEKYVDILEDIIQREVR